MPTKSRNIAPPHDEADLVGANYGAAEDHLLRHWDTGSGDLWACFETLGPIGVVRAETFEEALDAAVDEILPDAELEPEERAELERGEIPETVHLRGGEPANEGIHTCYAREDPNGFYIFNLTWAIADAWNIRLLWAV